MQLKTKWPIILGISCLLIGGVDAHQGHNHSPKAVLSHSEEEVRSSKLNKINEDYKLKIKPIFQRSCFNCHSGQTQYPWYYGIPGAKQLIDSDVTEAKKHIDLTNDFPFRGHGSPEEDLPAIRKAIEDDEMPPFRYWILHPESKIDQAERQIILLWIKKSLDELSKDATPADKIK